MDIESFVPPRVLAPLEYNAQGVHLICDLYDGKTRPYAYVECISVEAAEKLIRESDGKYLAGRQVAFRPVTQKELALDLFPNLRKNGYQRDVIVGSSPLRPGSAHHKPQSGQSGTNLELFTEESYQLFKVLFDRILAPPAKHFKTSHNKDDSQDGQADPSPVIFSFPPERPFARLVSMIVKYPHYAKNASNHPIQEYNEEIDRIMKCALCKLTMNGFYTVSPGLRLTLFPPQML